jgi:crotonobetainyl-CoA:carnitine CoA-transferase CaiB-like acyl-CoA transferase
MSPGVLTGLRVLDFGRFIAAPYCGMLLASMGADVIRVEGPDGDEDRRIGLTASNGENLTFPCLGRNKKGITLNLSGRAEARSVLADLVAHCDVLLHNFSPGAARALGLAYEEVRQIKADIIYTGISCYGADGPYAHRRGFDPMAQMGSGAAEVTGAEGHPPVRAGVPWVDYATGQCAALGTVLAVRYRDVTGEGQAVDCSLLETAVSFMTPVIAEALVTGVERPRLGNQPPYIGPSNLYECWDGRVYLTAITQESWRALAALIGHPELGDDPQLRSAAQRFESRTMIDTLIAGWTAALTTAEVVSALDEAGVPCGQYRTPSQVPDDPHIRARAVLDYVDSGSPDLGPLPVSGPAIRFSKTPGVKASRAPRVGEHNGEVYGRLLGYSRERIVRLQADRII